MYLVGAGPGAADLLTIRGLRLLQSADVIVHDSLVQPELYAALPARCIDAGKRSGDHGLGQDGIHALLIDLARQNLAVVRLKGGDPYVLGRGSEEALALAAAGVPCEVVPGVSSALAAPLLATPALAQERFPSTRWRSGCRSWTRSATRARCRSRS